MFGVMKNLPAYTWETILKEKVPRTMISAKLIMEERKEDEKRMKQRKK